MYLAQASPQLKLFAMMFEDAKDRAMLYRISPELTCTCDEFHECQQCYEERRQDANNASQETSIENSI